MQQDLSMVDKKVFNVSQGSYWLYPASNVILVSTVAKLELSSNLSAPHAFVCRVLIVL